MSDAGTPTPPVDDDADLPGCTSFDLMKREAESVFLVEGRDLFQGFMVTFNKILSNPERLPRFQTSHEILMAPKDNEHHPSSYNFTTTYQTQGAFHQGRVDTDGLLRTASSVQLPWNWNLVARGQYSSHPGIASILNLEFEHKKPAHSFTVKTQGDQALMLSYMQALTKRLHVGAELGLVPMRLHSALALGARYQTMKWVGTAKVDDKQDVHLSWKHDVNRNFSVAADLEYSLAKRASLVKVGYQYMLNFSRVRASVDSDLKIQAGVENVFLPTGGGTLAISGQLDQKTKDYKFGIGLTLGH